MWFGALMPDVRPEVLVFVTVGTDHHPFARLMEWIATWAHREQAQIVVQHGTTSPPAGVEGHEFLDPPHMESLLASAAAVVCAGGPGTIMDARRLGRRPIVVARRGDLGEHVDNHQVAFSHFLAAEEIVAEALTADDLHRALDAVVVDPTLYQIACVESAPVGIAHVGELIDELVWNQR